jgi:uncharacterized Zn-binding protein involved in type VI secretion
MGQPAAKQNDTITATDTHVVVIPGSPPTTSPLPHSFIGIINDQLSSDVKIMGLPAATRDSTADNTPPHVPTPPGTSFQTPPANKGIIKVVSQTVFINGKGAARNGDQAETCNDPVDALVGTVVALGTVMIGD